MTREDLISRLSERLGWAEPSTAKALEALIDTVVEELLAGNRVDISDFGLFQTRKQSEYILVDRETNERYLMPPSLEVVFEAAGVASDPALTSNIPRFIPDESLEKEVNSSFALFEPTLLNEGVQFPGMVEVYTDQLVEEGEARDPEEEEAELPRVEPVEEKILIPGEPAVEEVPSAVEEVPEELETFPAEKIEDEIGKEPPLEEPSVEVPPSEEPPVEEPPVEEPPMEEPREEPEDKPQPAPVLRGPVRRRPKKKSPVWIPVAGGVAIALAVLFFFNPALPGKINVNKGGFYSQQGEKTTGTDIVPAQPGPLAPQAGEVPSQTREIPPRTAEMPPQTEEIGLAEPEPVPSRLPRERIKLEKGKTLRMLAEDHFGHREFWVYIYLENKEHISNPNSIPHGTELLLPLPSAHDMNPTDPASIAKAKLLSDEILKAF